LSLAPAIVTTFSGYNREVEDQKLCRRKAITISDAELSYFETSFISPGAVEVSRRTSVGASGVLDKSLNQQHDFLLPLRDAPFLLFANAFLLIDPLTFCSLSHNGAEVQRRGRRCFRKQTIAFHPSWNLTLLQFNGKWVALVHTIVAYSAFLGALIVGCWLHYHKIVQNEYWGYPQEWFPSVSSTIGDRYPERSVFMIFIAITSGPRFTLVFLWYLLTARPNSALPKFIAGVGLFRTITCGGWTYVTSTDDHDWHDIFMISYLVATLPWTLGCLALSPHNPRAIRYRKTLAGLFFGTLVPLIYFFIQHKVHKVAGGTYHTWRGFFNSVPDFCLAYTIYAFFEWALILFDVGFDAVTALDFEGLELVVKDVKGASRGYVQWLPK
jgi:hypothetical protein